MGVRLFRVSVNDSVEGEDIGVLGVVEGAASGGETAAFGVKEDEVVGKVCGRRKEGLDVECVEGFACKEVSVGNACFQKVAKALQITRELVHLTCQFQKRIVRTIVFSSMQQLMLLSKYS